MQKLPAREYEYLYNHNDYEIQKRIISESLDIQLYWLKFRWTTYV